MSGMGADEAAAFSIVETAERPRIECRGEEGKETAKLTDTPLLVHHSVSASLN